MMGFTEKSQPYGGGTEAVIMEKTRLFTFAGRVLEKPFSKTGQRSSTRLRPPNIRSGCGDMWVS